MKTKYLPILILIVVVLTILPLVYAQSTKMNEPISLVQTCNNCTYCNITKILNPSKIIILQNLEMGQDGVSFNYTINSSFTNQIGNYDWFYICGNDVESETGKLTFEVTPTGFDNLLGFYIIILIIPWILFILGLWKKDMTFAILGTIGFYLIALYLLIFGIDGNKDWLTNGLGIIYLGVAFYTSIRYTLESIDINW